MTKCTDAKRKIVSAKSWKWPNALTLYLPALWIAAWDVIHSCTIRGSSDASIKDVVANDLTLILDHAPIRQIYVNGKTAEKMYKKYIEPKIGRKAVCLPSTSPANAAWSLERLTEAWKAVREGAGH